MSELFHRSTRIQTCRRESVLQTRSLPLCCNNKFVQARLCPRRPRKDFKRQTFVLSLTVFHVPSKNTAIRFFVRADFGRWDIHHHDEAKKHPREGTCLHLNCQSAKSHYSN